MTMIRSGHILEDSFVTYLRRSTPVCHETARTLNSPSTLEHGCSDLKVI